MRSIVSRASVFPFPMSLPRAVCSAVVSRPRSLSLAAAIAVAVVAVGAHGAAGQTTPTLPGSPSAPGTPGTTGVALKGSTVIRLDPVLFQAVTASGAKVRAGKPATATKTGVKFRVSAVSLGQDGASYVLRHKGSMRISTRTRSVALANPSASVDPTSLQGEMTATVGGKKLRIATLQLDIGRLEETGSGFYADNVNLAMTARLATELNRVLRTNTLTEGTTFGKATVKVDTGD